MGIVGHHFRKYYISRFMPLVITRQGWCGKASSHLQIGEVVLDLGGTQLPEAWADSTFYPLYAK